MQVEISLSLLVKIILHTAHYHILAAAEYHNRIYQPCGFGVSTMACLTKLDRLVAIQLEFHGFYEGCFPFLAGPGSTSL